MAQNVVSKNGKKYKYDYITKYFTIDGKQYKVRGKTEEEVYRKKFELQMQLKNGETVSGGNTLLKDWYEKAFYTYKPNVSEEYLEEMLLRFKKHVISEIGNFPLSKITPIQCQEIMNGQKNMSKSHITKLAQELNFVFDCAVKNNMLLKNPAADIVRPAGTNNKRRAITAEEREHLLKVIPSDPRYVFFELMLYCGCRPEEAASVEYEDVVDIDETPFLHIRGTKTANSDRFVPIPTEIRPLLLNRQKTGLVAPNSRGKKHSESSYKRMVSCLKRDMNISMGCIVYRNQLIPPLPLAPDFVPYLLRHTYCTDLKKKGVDVRIAKDLMGHADIKTTANIYDHDDNETLIMAAKQMGLYRK